ncbi:MAG: low temperature requirement protein A, partial [Actinomycetota bacterium]
MGEGDRDETAGSHALAHMSEWLELFYDLVFVAAILIFSTAVSHHSDLPHVLRVVAVFVALWWVWFSTTLSMNRFPREDTAHRMLLLAQMLVIAFVALEVNGGVRRDEDYLALTFGVLVLLLAAMYWRAARDPGPYRRFAQRMAGL